MSICSEVADNVVDSSFIGYSPLSSYEREVQERCRLRLGTDYVSPLKASRRPTAEVDSEDVSYQKIRESLIILLERPPTHEEIVGWLEKCYRAHDYGFNNFSGEMVQL